MVNKRAIVVVVAIVAAIIYISLERPDPLIARIDDFVEEFEGAQGKSALAQAMRVTQLLEYFDSQLTVDVSRYGHRRDLDRDDIKRLLLMAQNSRDPFTVKIIDPVVVVRGEAQGSVEALLRIEYARETTVSQVHLDMLQRNGVWLFRGCSELEMLEK